MDPVQAQVLETREDGVPAAQRTTDEVYPPLRVSGGSAAAQRECDVAVLFL